MTSLLLLAAVFIAFANGANDNMKGVATLYGSGVLSYRRALALATASTALGSLASLALAPRLAQAFSARGLVPDAVLGPGLLAAVALAAALTVLAATGLGLPVSTTHALVGGLAGAALVGAGRDLDVGALGGVFLLPLLVSPLAATLLAGAVYRAARRARQRLGIEATSCVCIGEEWVPVGSSVAAAGSRISVGVGTTARCQQRYSGSLAGVSAQALVSAAHLASAALVGFARGFNDTPKILGLMAGGAAFSTPAGAVAVVAAMAAGGWVAARRVAETLARKITPMNPGQGVAGNLATSLLVVGATRFGLPVSTTHVSTGSIVGVGCVSGEVYWRMVGSILAAWVTTFPLAAALGAAAMWVLSAL